jgi:hypothetical protein
VSYNEARRLYAELEGDLATESDGRLRGLIRNDLAVLAPMEGHFDEARQGWSQVLEIDRDCLQARLNDALVAAELEYVNSLPDEDVEPFVYAPAPGSAAASSSAADGPRPVAGRDPQFPVQRALHRRWERPYRRDGPVPGAGWV